MGMPYSGGGTAPSSHIVAFISTYLIRFSRLIQRPPLHGGHGGHGGGSLRTEYLSRIRRIRREALFFRIPLAGQGGRPSISLTCGGTGSQDYVLGLIEYLGRG